MKNLMIIGIIATLVSCSTSKKAITTPLLDDNTFVLSEISTDKTYGYTEKNPIKVGGVDKSEGPINERRFLNALAGPEGESISYYRAKSCCSFKTENGFMGKGLLDKYRVSWEGSRDTVSIYINMYDYGELKAPVGFTIK